VRVEPGTRLHRVVGALSATVNTRHHQAIREVAPGLSATAWAEDGVIEGVERDSADAPWTLAVQWHPEDDVEGALFDALAEAIA
jgi:gamma-glutamyl-gamma-aminobutyrate hydrolase PuuD